MPKMTKERKRVVVFTAPSCPYCRAVKSYLTQQQVRFKEVDVSRDQRAARDLVRKTGQMGVPVVLIGGRPVVGFNRPKIDELLDR
ncbi:MAG: glutaredoxin domain-containing protein [Chloroflexota bacterium]|nr:glutaredoxin domain-containing protein [Chloroflexota bacterium]